MKPIKTYNQSIKSVKRKVTEIVNTKVIIDQLELDGTGRLLSIERPFIDADGNRNESYRMGVTLHSAPCGCVVMNANIMCACGCDEVLEVFQQNVPTEFLLAS